MGRKRTSSDGLALPRIIDAEDEELANEAIREEKLANKILREQELSDQKLAARIESEFTKTKQLEAKLISKYRDDVPKLSDHLKVKLGIPVPKKPPK